MGRHRMPRYPAPRDAALLVVLLVVLVAAVAACALVVYGPVGALMTLTLMSWRRYPMSGPGVSDPGSPPERVTELTLLERIVAGSLSDRERVKVAALVGKAIAATRTSAWEPVGQQVSALLEAVPPPAVPAPDPRERADHGVSRGEFDPARMVGIAVLIILAMLGVVAVAVGMGIW